MQPRAAACHSTASQPSSQAAAARVSRSNDLHRLRASSRVASGVAAAHHRRTSASSTSLARETARQEVDAPASASSEPTSSKQAICSASSFGMSTSQIVETPSALKGGAKQGGAKSGRSARASSGSHT